MIAVIRFPGSNCDLDAMHALKDLVKVPVELVWHEQFDQSKYAGVVLPGGFSYGDHLRAGVIAAFSPAMDGVRKMAESGKPVLGICNGFQVLTESGLLPGALLRNEGILFSCKWVNLKVESQKSFFSKGMGKRSVFRIPIAHGEGRYFISEGDYRELEKKGQIIFRYVDDLGNPTEQSNPNGSIYNVAGICNEAGNVLGMMPHPERASELALGGDEAKKILDAFKV
jgi:phosphoribosylformylglycinamidine synthase subunit PurQ / glutaminase